jgi:hypothetical protein
LRIGLCARRARFRGRPKAFRRRGIAGILRRLQIVVRERLWGWSPRAEYHWHDCRRRESAVYC